MPSENDRSARLGNERTKKYIRENARKNLVSLTILKFAKKGHYHTRNCQNGACLYPEQHFLQIETAVKKHFLIRSYVLGEY